jgi:hypothetical protein
MATIAERVAAGMALLDEKAPGWVSRINLGHLALGSCDRCVLGQVFGYYDDGLVVLDFDPDYEGGEEFGFESNVEPYEDLTAEWVRQISARLATPAPAATDGGDRS